MNKTNYQGRIRHANGKKAKSESYHRITLVIKIKSQSNKDSAKRVVRLFKLEED